ncbi:LEA-like protein [Aphelenchoides avenae]|uniref:LEA-like protein n=1 Tax=Aphelenchoides avenae TaxID=70226 RepID=A5H2U9_APHAV|nr:LEA-like protein [Aphelenchus avenae]KAH7712018.1 LEA-like protein [Aphelenchus avenae]
MSKREEKHTVRTDECGRTKEEHKVKRTGAFAEGGEKAPGILDKASDVAHDAWEATKEAASNAKESLQETFAPKEPRGEVHREVRREGPYGERIEKEEFHRRI